MARTDRQRRSTNIEDRRGMSPAGGGQAASMGLVLLLRLLVTRAGRTLLLVLVLAGILGFAFFPRQTQEILSQIFGGEAVQTTQLDPDEQARLADDAAAVLGSTEDVWSAIFTARGESYPPPTLVLYTGAVDSACGYATAAVGPFYCPGDRKLYLDLGFFKDMETQLRAPGDFARAYVIAHEIGHHVQNLEGVLASANAAQQAAGDATEANHIQVRIELMADCLAGVWAGEAERKSEIELEPGDVGEAVGAAEAVGDDTLQRRAEGRVVPDAFTHGTAAQRMRWLERGMNERDTDACAETQTLPYERL